MTQPGDIQGHLPIFLRQDFSQSVPSNLKHLGMGVSTSRREGTFLEKDEKGLERLSLTVRQGADFSAVSQGEETGV